MTNIASYYGINSKKLHRHYKHKISGFKSWDQLEHANEYMIYPENMSDKLSIDELSLSKGELYTFVTNKNIKVKNKQSIVAIINGTQASVIEEVLKKLPECQRNKVTEISLDMARNMGLAVRKSFPFSKLVIDRFHVVKLVLDAMQHIRVKYRWEAIENENIAIQTAKDKKEKYTPVVLENGDTLKEILARSKYLLYKYESEWTANQIKRVQILFREFPLMETIYKLTLSFRNIYKCSQKELARIYFFDWKEQIEKLDIKEFNTVVNSLEYHLDDILNFFNNKSTNANAESFNAKIKRFRANLRGVVDVKFFLFRLEKLYAI